MRTIYFDMDGTIANFYGVEGWLNDLINENDRPYRNAKPLINMQRLAHKLNNLQKKGFRIGIISWGSKNSSENFLENVKTAKMDWLNLHLNSVKWNEIHIVPYGTPKEIFKKKDDILFDDEELNRKNWKYNAYTEKEIFTTLATIA